MIFEKEKLFALLQEIPYGMVITFGELARMLGDPKWARAVGNALHRNMDGDRYPCYKVVNSQGRLSPSYAFGGIQEQARRLEAENIVVQNGKVDLKRYAYYNK